MFCGVVIQTKQHTFSRILSVKLEIIILVYFRIFSDILGYSRIFLDILGTHTNKSQHPSVNNISETFRYNNVFSSFTPFFISPQKKFFLKKER